MQTYNLLGLIFEDEEGRGAGGGQLAAAWRVQKIQQSLTFEEG